MSFIAEDRLYGTCRLLLLSVVFSGPMFAQGVRFSCAEPAEISNLTINEIQRRVYAGEDDFFLYKRLEDLTPDRPRPGTLAPLIEQKLKGQPNDPRLEYLYGRSLIGKRTPDALVHLTRAAELAPDLPWTYTSLAKIYSSRNFKDDGKLLVAMRAYRTICPVNLDGFAYLSSDSDLAESARWSRELRNLLERSTRPPEGRYWNAVWAAEFRTAPKSEYPELRQRVAGDVRRLELIPEPRPSDLLVDLWTGYRLVEQPDLAAKIDRRLNPENDARKAEQAFRDEVRWTTQLSPADRDAASRELERRAEGWVQEWPNSRVAWSQLLEFLPYKPDWSKDEMEHAGDELLKADAAMHFVWNPAPEKLSVAKQWLKYGIRVQDCVRMAEETVEEVSIGPEEPNDLSAPPNWTPNAYTVNHSLMAALGVVVDGSIQMKDFDRVRRAIARMQKWTEDNQALAENRSAGYWSLRGIWLNSRGKLAEAEGHKMDAIAFYGSAIASRADDPDIAQHARTLWDELGGTKEGWDSLIANGPVPPKPPVPAKIPVSVASQFAAWHDIGKPLAEMNIPDLSGRSWTLADLTGKTTFVSIWATWCPPCHEELPSVQKLYELAKNQNGIQVITLNVDDDPGLVGPFLAANHFSFPVLMSAPQYPVNMTGPLSIPQNWIVDRGVTLREKSSGYDSKLADWPGEMLKRLTVDR